MVNFYVLLHLCLNLLSKAWCTNFLTCNALSESMSCYEQIYCIFHRSVSKLQSISNPFTLHSDEKSSLDALQTLADLSLMFPDSKMESGMWSMLTV